MIADFPFPYSKFARGTAQWVALKVTPTRVPPESFICAGFNPTATKGVYLSSDGEASGRSYVGLPGGDSRAFTGGDWLIRAIVRSKQ